MEYLISLAPILLYFIIIKGFDGFSLTRWSKLLECLMWGIACCVFCFLLGRAVQFTADSDSVLMNVFKTVGIFPLIEEAAKCLPLLVAIHRKRSAFFSETILYGAAIGAGFALLENVLYIVYSQGFTLGDAILRGFGTALLHMGCTALFACTALLCCRVAYHWNVVARVLFSLVAIFPPFVLHFLYNLFLLPEFLQMVIFVVLIIAMLMFIYEMDSKLIHKWLDLCINNDISLMKAIREGNLKSTNAGKYLLKARERFQSEVFFDICVYLGLYLDVSIAAKSRMIMKEAGIDIPMSDEEHWENHGKIVELASLRKNIGKSGVLFLSPLVNSKAVDEWVMSELL